MEQEINFSGIGNTVYIGHMDESGALPKIDSMVPVKVKEPAHLDSENDKEHKGWQQSFTVTFEHSDEGIDNEKKLIDIEVKIADMNVKDCLDYIEKHHLHGRVRKAEIRFLLKRLKRAKARLSQYRHNMVSRINAEESLSYCISLFYLELGKAVTMSIAPNGVDGMPVNVKVRRINGKITLVS